MSGQLVGEVIDAAEAGTLPPLSRPAFSALLAIAEKCHTVTRQGSVRQERIRAAIFAQNSSRTAVRAVKELRDAGLVSVVKRGFKAPDGSGGATIYELARLSEAHATQVACADSEAHATQVAYATGEAHAKSGEAHAKSDQAHATQGGAFDGSIDGSIDGGRAQGAAPPPAEPLPDKEPPRYCNRHPGGTTDRCGDCGDARKAHERWQTGQTQRAAEAAQAKRNAIARCALCDEAGWLLDSDGLPNDDGIRCDHQDDAA